MSKYFSLIILISISYITQQRIIHYANEQQCYGVMFDAGSSGTRASVYSWPCREIQNVPKVNINQVPYKKTQPGISAFNENLEGLVQYFAPLIEFAKLTVPQNQIGATPIMLGATAGMRLLPQEDQQNIIQKVRIIFQQSGFYFPNDKWARVITGEQEANYLWLSINYLKGTLFTDNIQDTYNTIDLGGASTQIAIRQQKKNKISKDYVIDSRDNFLYGKSYLGYGNDVTRNEIIKMSINDESKTILSPCFNQGYQGEWLNDKSYTIEGTGDPDECVKLINDYIQKDNKKNECKQNHQRVCTMQNQNQPRVGSSDKFIAVSTFLYVAQSFHLDRANITTLLNDSYDFCSKNWTEVITDPQYKSNPYAYSICFSDLYSTILLKNGYKIPTDLNIEYPNKISGVEPGWTLAGVFYQIQLSSCQNESPVCKKFQEFF